MQTKAERAMELYAKVYMAKRLSKFVNNDNFPVLRRRKSGGAPQILDMMELELKELRRQMGGSERRKFEQLKAEWEKSVVTTSPG